LQCQLVIDWLEQNASDQVQEEAQLQHFTDKTVAWENTLHQLQVLFSTLCILCSHAPSILQDCYCKLQELPDWIVQERTMLLTQACMLKISYFKWLCFLFSEIRIVDSRKATFNHQPDQIMTGLDEPTLFAGNWIKQTFLICVWSTQFHRLNFWAVAVRLIFQYKHLRKKIIFWEGHCFIQQLHFSEMENNITFFA
jgi:hypothetical protein